MTKLEFVCSDEKSVVLLKAARLFDEGVELEPVRHGYWIQSKSVPAYHSCSYCHAAHKMHESCNTYVLLNYCPNCGTKMDAEVV